MAPPSNAHPATRALHADDSLNQVTDVAPPIHTSTTFRYPNDPGKLVPSEDPVVSTTKDHREKLGVRPTNFPGRLHRH